MNLDIRHKFGEVKQVGGSGPTINKSMLLLGYEEAKVDGQPVADIAFQDFEKGGDEGNKTVIFGKTAFVTFVNGDDKVRKIVLFLTFVQNIGRGREMVWTS